jgi:hypothetical protein
VYFCPVLFSLLRTTFAPRTWISTSISKLCW